VAIKDIATMMCSNNVRHSGENRFYLCTFHPMHAYASRSMGGHGKKGEDKEDQAKDGFRRCVDDGKLGL
jgi:hypothetical protein